MTDTSNLTALGERLQQQAQSAAATAAHLQRIESRQRECAQGPFRVFESAATGLLFVLRDVGQLDGTELVYEHDLYAMALAWMNHRMAGRAASAEIARRYDDLWRNGGDS